MCWSSLPGQWPLDKCCVGGVHCHVHAGKVLAAYHHLLDDIPTVNPLDKCYVGGVHCHVHAGKLLACLCLPPLTR